MDYEKAYKDLIKRIKDALSDQEVSDADFGVVIGQIAPELAESEDERIRKSLINLLSSFELMRDDATFRKGDFDFDAIKGYISYLEKQKDEAQRQFNLGMQAGREEVMYETEKEQKPAESDSIKGGDFISDGKRVFLVLANVEERNFGEIGSFYCESLILGVDGVVYCNGDDFKKYKRATSDERAKFIHDLKVGVKLKEQPAEWSEEDERIMQDIKFNFEYNKGKMTNALQDEYNQFFKKLKSLRPNSWKPTSEQMYLLNWLTLGLGDGPVAEKARKVMESLYEDLKKL